MIKFNIHHYSAIISISTMWKTVPSPRYLVSCYHAKFYYKLNFYAIKLYQLAYRSSLDILNSAQAWWPMLTHCRGSFFIMSDLTDIYFLPPSWILLVGRCATSNRFFTDHQYISQTHWLMILSQKVTEFKSVVLVNVHFTCGFDYAILEFKLVYLYDRWHN